MLLSWLALTMKVPLWAHGKGPNFAVMAVDALYLLELVAVPVFYCAVFAAAEEMVAVAVAVVWDKCDLENAVPCVQTGTLWQSPKSRPQIFTFLSAELVTMSLLS